MYTTSQAFKNAIANNNPQIAMLLFSDAVFTNSDIRVDKGIELNETFNAEEDLAIGQTPSNELLFTLFNDGMHLNDYGFGEFIATIGVKISETIQVQKARVMVDTGSSVWSIALNSSVLMKNGVAVSIQPDALISTILIYNGLVYCFSDTGYAVVYNEATGAKDNRLVNDFMRNKAKSIYGLGAYYDNSTRLLKLFNGEYIETYEFMPFGVFNAERPNVPTKIEIDFTCYDRMQKFECDMPSSTELNIVYPTTIGMLFVRMCQYLNVPYRTSTFINSSATIDSEPEAFGTATMRTVLGWIAEAAASNARFDRDGYLIMDWLKNTNVVIDEGGYSEFEPYWYQTPNVTKIYNRDTSSGSDITYGNDGSSYLIQDNPLLKGVN